jgi:hypothetical protein
MNEDQEPIIDEIVESAPAPDIPEEVTIEPNITSNLNKEIPPETIEFSKENTLNNLKPQENKYWRFAFKKNEHMNLLENTIKNIGLNLTVVFEMKQNTPDISILQGDNEVGKINLLLCDRRDANLPDKYYCKVYFYHFKDQEIYQAVKAAVVNFFENLKSNNTPLKEYGGKRKKGRTNKKRNMKRKKTMKRKLRK